MELWKPIPGYEGIYDASFDGHIRSSPNKTTSNARYPVRVWKSRILRQKVTKNIKGRFDARVCLWKDGKEHTYLVSRLVAMTWCAGYSEGMTVNHIDGNPLNNMADNLEWVSLRQNINHAFESGLNKCNEPVCLINSQNGASHSFRSMSMASVWLGRNTGYVSACIKGNRTAKGKNGIEYGIST